MKTLLGLVVMIILLLAICIVHISWPIFFILLAAWIIGFIGFIINNLG